MKRESAPHTTPLLRLTLLGGVHCALADEPLTTLASAKARALLVFLAVTQQTHSRDALAGLLWPDMADIKAKANLRQALTKLRQLLPDQLHITRQAVSVNPGAALEVDTRCFEDAATAGLAGDLG